MRYRNENGVGGEGMMTEKEYKARENVIVSVSEWIIRETKNASSPSTESILADVIHAFAELVANN